jgi:hypothetical protein
MAAFFHILSNSLFVLSFEAKSELLTALSFAAIITIEF